jgi:hypothetical protein
MLALFDPPINDIVKLVESQVKAARSKGEKIHVCTAVSHRFVQANNFIASFPRGRFWRITILEY